MAIPTIPAEIRLEGPRNCYRNKRKIGDPPLNVVLLQFVEARWKSHSSHKARDVRVRLPARETRHHQDVFAHHPPAQIFLSSQMSLEIVNLLHDNVGQFLKTVIRHFLSVSRCSEK